MRPMTLTRLERWVWYLFLATCAWQTRLILWQADLHFVEWRSIPLYASDVLMFGMFGLAVVQTWRKKLNLDHLDWTLIGFLVVSLISVGISDQRIVSLYAWARLLQCALLFWYVRYRAKTFSFDIGAVAFVLGTLFQGWLGMWQYFLQHDVGLRWLGETLLTTHLPGIAVFYDLAGTKILRAYGTLPHPNVLAVYLVAALWVLGYLYMKHRHWIYGVAGTIMLWALYLTFSRTMIAVGLLATAIYALIVVRQHLKPILIWWVVVTAIFGAVFWRQIAARSMISPQDEAVTLRVYYAKEALRVNWTGVGIGNFVTWMKRADPGHPDWFYQPAHNLYLLVYSETGLVGILTFVALLVLVIRSAIRTRRWGWLTVLAAFLIMALFDHFFWTLQQGRIIIWITLALMS